MATQGPYLPGTASNTIAYGNAWSNVDNIKTEDGTFATVNVSTNPTDTLEASNFGFSIPSSSVITNVLVQVKGKISSGTYTINGYVSLIGNTPTFDLTTSNSWHTIYNGGPVSLTATYLNTSSFGVTLTADSSGTDLTISIDAIKVTVTYSCPVPAITSSTPLTTGVYYQAYSNTLAGSSSSGTWSLSSGTLPTGLSLSSAGVISGTPTSKGTSTFQVTLTNTTCDAATTSKWFDLTIGDPVTTGTYQQTILGTTGLVGYWPLDNTWEDIKGTNDLTILDTPAFNSTTYKFGTSSGSFSRVSNSGAYGTGYTTLTNYSLECWVYMTAWPTGNPGIICNIKTSDENAGGMIYYNAGASRFAFKSMNKTILANDAPSLNTWYHLVATCSAAGAMKLYVDGTQQTATDTQIPTMTGTTFLLSRKTTGATTDGITGLIDEAAVYNVVLSGTTIGEHYAFAPYSSGADTFPTGSLVDTVTVTDTTIKYPLSYNNQSYVMSSDTGAWSFIDNHPFQSHIYRPYTQDMIASRRDTGQISYVNSGDTFGGDDINASMQTGYFDFGKLDEAQAMDDSSSEGYKKLRALFADIKSDASLDDITLTVRTEEDTTGHTFTITGSSTSIENVRTALSRDIRGKFISLAYNNNNGSWFWLGETGLKIIAKNRR